MERSRNEILQKYRVQYEEFKLNNLFDISTTKGFDKDKVIFNEAGDCDFIGRTSINYGIQTRLFKIPNINPNPKGSFSLIQVGETQALWRENDWYASQNLFVLNPKNLNISNTYLYLQSIINKCMEKYKNGYNNYPTLKTLNEESFQLPVQKNKLGYALSEPSKYYHPNGYVPDWTFMKKYITANKKLVVANIIKWKDEEIAKTKETLNRNND